MGKTSKKQRDQKRYEQELATRKEEERLRKEVASKKQVKQGEKLSDSGPVPLAAGSQPSAANYKGKRAGMYTTTFELNAGSQIVWQPGEPTRTLLFPGGEDPDGFMKFIARYSRFVVDAGLDSQIIQDLRNGVKPDEERRNELESRGACLVLICSELHENSSLPDAGQRSLINDLLIPEANFLLLAKRLPLPQGVDRNELFIPRPQEGVVPWHDKPRHDQSSKESHLIFDAEMKVNQLKGDNSELKTNLSALKAEVKEAYQARDRKEGENQELRSRISEVKEEEEEKIEMLRQENTRLRTTSSTFTHSSSSKSTFVVQALSKQVKNLSRELKEKNDQLAELMTELTKSG
ncbi:hypothetical protein JCM5350_006630 [Sporobolomyces pararoseus]